MCMVVLNFSDCANQGLTRVVGQRRSQPLCYRDSQLRGQQRRPDPLVRQGESL